MSKQKPSAMQAPKSLMQKDIEAMERVAPPPAVWRFEFNSAIHFKVDPRGGAPKPLSTIDTQSTVEWGVNYVQLVQFGETVRIPYGSIKAAFLVSP